jgi:hypothetical protein
MSRYLVAVVVACAACSGGTPAATPDGGAGGPLYVVSHSILTEESATSYVTVVPSLGAGPPVDLSKSMEFGGGARAYGPPGADAVYVTSSEDGTITEVTFGADGAPKRGRTVSFAGLGISGTTGGNVHHFVSPTKAYFVSQDIQEIVVWNPAAMTLTKSVPLDLAAKAPTAAGFYFYPRPIVVGGRLVLVSNAANDDDHDDGAVVSVIDTGEDRVLSTTAEPRCHGMLQSAVDAQGDRYFASSDYSAAAHFKEPDKEPAPCMLRMRAGETAFDASWTRTLTETFGSQLWTGVTPGANGRLFVQTIAEDAPSVLAAVEPYDVTIAQPWRWKVLTGGDAAPEPLDVDYLSSPPVFPAFDVDGKAYVSLWDDADTTLVDLTSGATPQKGLVITGFVFNVVRIR